MKKPSLQEWKRENPGKGVNDYFKAFPDLGNDIFNGYPVADQRPHNQILPETQPTVPYQSNPTTKKEPVSIVSVLASLMILVGFFLPWLNLNLLGKFEALRASGFELPDLIKVVDPEFSPTALILLYLLPLCAFITLVTEIARNGMKVVAQVIAIAVAAYWSYVLRDLITVSTAEPEISLDLFELFSHGLYLTMLGCLYYLYELIREFF